MKIFSYIFISMLAIFSVTFTCYSHELETIPGIYVYGSNGNLVVQNRRQSPLPAIIILVKYNDRESWENSDSLMSESINDISIEKLIASNGTTLMADILLDYEDEHVLLGSGENGYYKILTCWGNYNDVLFDDVPADFFLGDWMTKLLRYAKTENMTVEHFLKYASTVMNSFGTLATAFAAVDPTIGVVSAFQDLVNDPEGMTGVINKITNGPQFDGTNGDEIAFNILQYAEEEIAGKLEGVFYDSTSNMSRLINHWIKNTNLPANAMLYLGALKATTWNDEVGVIYDLVMHRKITTEHNIYVNENGELSPEAIVPNLKIDYHQESDQIRLQLSADESLVLTNVTGLQYTWIIDELNTNGNIIDTHAILDLSTASLLLDTGSRISVTLSMSGYRNGVFYAPRPIRSEIILPFATEEFGATLTGSPASTAMAYDFTVSLNSITIEDITQMCVDYGDNTTDVVNSFSGTSSFNIRHVYSTEGDYSVRATLLLTDGRVATITTSASLSDSDSEASIIVLSPSTGRTFTLGDPMTIYWGGSEDISGENVRIELLRDGSVESIISSSVSIDDAAMTWNIPTTVTPSSNYTVKISLADDSNVSGTSRVFSILEESSPYDLAPCASPVEPEFKTNTVRQGDRVKIKVRGTDNEGGLDKVIYSVSDSRMSESFIPSASSGNAQFNDTNDTFDDGYDDTEYSYITFTGYNNNNPIYVYATVYDEGGQSDSFEWIFNVERVYSPILTPIEPAELEVALPLGTHEFSLNLFDEDDNTEQLDWYVDGTFVSSENTNGGNPIKDENEDFSFTEQKVYTVEARATDDDGNSTSLIWTVNAGVAPDGNIPPVIDYLEQHTEVQYTKFRIGREYEFEGQASDADNNLSYVALLVDGVIVNEDTSTNTGDEDLRYLVSFTTTGEHTISFLARDGGGLEASKTLTLDVLPADETASSPSEWIDIWPKGSNLSTGGDYVDIGGTIRDVDFDMAYLDWYVDGSFAKRDSLYNNTSFDARSPDMSAGTHTLSLVIKDGAGNASVTKTWSVVVGTQGNHAPTIEKAAPVDGPIYVPTGEQGELLVLCSDPDGDLGTIVWNYSNVGYENDDGYVRGYFDMADDSFRPTESGTVTATVYDGKGNSSSVSFSVIVVDSLQNHPPAILHTNIEDGANYQVVPANQDVDIWVDFHDPDGDLLTIEVFSNASLWKSWDIGNEFWNDSSFYTRATDCDLFEFDNNLTRGESTIIVIRGTDSMGNTSEVSFTLTYGPMADMNHSPEVDTNIGFSVDQRNSYIFSVNATDEEGDTLTKTVSGLTGENAVNFLENNSFEFVPEDDFYGTEIFTIQWSDGFGGIATTEVTATVNRVVLPPQISPDKFSVTIGESGVFDLGTFLRDFVITDGYSLDSLTVNLVVNTNCQVSGNTLGGESSLLLLGDVNSSTGSITATIKTADGLESNIKTADGLESNIFSVTVSIALTRIVYYIDQDDDGYGDPNNFIEAIAQPEGYVANNDDCDDTDPGRNPGAVEIPDDGIDQDCDGSDLIVEPSEYDGFAISESKISYGSDYKQVCKNEFGSEWEIADWEDLKTYYSNGGNLNDLVEGIGFDEKINAWVTRNGDQSYSSDRDYFASFHNYNKPSGYLAHDNIDNYFLSLGSWDGSYYVLCYCENMESPNLKTYYKDYDGDGYGDSDSPYEATSQPSGYVMDDTDCNDFDSSIHPGAVEIADDGIDQDCDGSDLNSSNNPSDYLILTDSSPITVPSESVTDIYGCAGTNNLIIEKGASVNLINMPGNNTIKIQSDSSLFTVSRSGTYITFEGTGGTVLKIPATTTSQSIIFNDESLSLIIDSGRVLLGNQVVELVNNTGKIINMMSDGAYECFGDNALCFWFSIAQLVENGSVWIYPHGGDVEIFYDESIKKFDDIGDMSSFQYQSSPVGPVQVGDVVIIHNTAKDKYGAIQIDSTRIQGNGIYEQFLNATWYVNITY